MGILGFICFQFMIRNTEIRVNQEVVLNEEKPKFNVWKAFINFMKNRPAVGATVAAMAMFLGMNSATTATTIMFATYFNRASLSGIVMAIGFVPMLFFMPFIKKIVNKYGKKESSAVGAFVSVLGGVLMLVFPLISNKTIALVLFVLALSVFGIGLGIYTCVSWAFMADAIDYNEWKTGKREEGIVYSLHSFFRKLAQGVGPSIVLLLMGALGYVSELGTQGQSIPTAYNMCWLVAGLYLFSAVLMFISIAFIYNLDKKTLSKMNKELEEKRAQESVQVEAPQQAE
jgi:GPH family glycoside/pentoside/hexuronide:cation symporter